MDTDGVTQQNSRRPDGTTIVQQNQNTLQQQQQQIDNSESAVEAMDTQESDIILTDQQQDIIDNISNNGDTAMQLVPQLDSTTTAISMDATSTTDVIINNTTNINNSGNNNNYYIINNNNIKNYNNNNNNNINILSAAVTIAEEEIRSEATFSFTVDEFSKLKDSILSPPYYVRNLPWKIMVMPRSDRNQSDAKSLGFFLQCNGDSESSSWSCNAVAELRLKSFKSNQEPFVRKIKHLFYSKENDWGFSYFISWNEILDPEKGYVQNDTIILEVHVVAEAPHGVFWDSKKHTGNVGLKNQGATCYMNSLLQTLFFTGFLRKAVYKMPTEADDSSKSVALALQRVFYELQFSDKPVGTKKLTKSFGWETLDSFMQHDVQEFLRVLLDKLESKMKGTCVEGTIPILFEGKMSSYIKCKNIDYKSTRIETFYDIQLNIKGKKNIEESFNDYIKPETLEGDNKYDAGIHGFQEAEKGVIFKSFPPVLHLHLMRFQYDPVTDNSVKFNDRFEFYEEIHLDKYLAENEQTPANYRLHAVLVHSGDNHGGHYVVYINPKADGKWCKFDDDVVSSCTKIEAIENNYGGIDDELTINAKHCSNAYMLVYIRVSEIPKILEDIVTNDIPSELNERLCEEKRMEQVRRRERSEANTYVFIHVILEEYFDGHQTTDLFDNEKIHPRVFKLKKTQTCGDLMQVFVETFKVDQSRMRLWPLVSRSQLTRPIYFDINEEYNRNLSNVIETQSPWIIYLQMASPDQPGPLPRFIKNRDILLFFKFYDPMYKRLNYIGSRQYELTTKLIDLVPELNMELGLQFGTELSIYEEQGTNVVQKIQNLNETIEKALKTSREDAHGNVLIFEKKHQDEKLDLPTCDDYFRDLLYRIEVTFVDKCNPNDSGFTLELSHRNTYDQMAQAVAQKINTDPTKIQFFKCLGYKDQPGNPLRCMYDGSLKDLLAYNKPRTVKKVFYQRLSMSINELENKKQFKCIWLSLNLKDEKDLVLYPNKNGTIKTLLEEAAKQVEFSEESTRKLRLLEISSHKIFPMLREDTLLENLQSISETMTNQTSQKTYRIEEVHRDEIILIENEMLIPVAHYSKEIYNSFGIPFFIKVKQNELFTTVKERIQKKLNVPEKEWEKFKFTMVSMGRIEFLTDDSLINFENFRPTNSQAGSPLPYIGLDHINKSQKRSRYTYLEKAIKIYN